MQWFGFPTSETHIIRCNNVSITCQCNSYIEVISLATLWRAVTLSRVGGGVPTCHPLCRSTSLEFQRIEKRIPPASLFFSRDQCYSLELYIPLYLRGGRNKYRQIHHHSPPVQQIHPSLEPCSPGRCLQSTISHLLPP